MWPKNHAKEKNLLKKFANEDEGHEKKKEKEG